EAYLREAAKGWGDFVFASRVEEIPILNYAVKRNPEDAYAHLHLGNLYANFGRLDEAVEKWTQAVDLNFRLAMAFRNLGLYQWKTKSNTKEAEGLYRKAIAANPRDQTLYRDLGQILLATHKEKEAIRLLADMPFDIQK